MKESVCALDRYMVFENRSCLILSVASLATLDAMRLAMILKETAQMEHTIIKRPQSRISRLFSIGITESIIWAKI